MVAVKTSTSNLDFWPPSLNFHLLCSLCLSLCPYLSPIFVSFFLSFPLSFLFLYWFYFVVLTRGRILSLEVGKHSMLCSQSSQKSSAVAYIVCNLAHLCLWRHSYSFRKVLWCIRLSIYTWFPNLSPFHFLLVPNTNFDPCLELHQEFVLVEISVHSTKAYPQPCCCRNLRYQVQISPLLWGVAATCWSTPANAAISHGSQ